MKKIFGIAMMVCASLAFAGGNSNNNNSDTYYNTDNSLTQLQGQTQSLNNDVRVGMNANITNDVRNNATAYANSLSNSKSDSTSLSGAYSGGNTQSVTVTDSGGIRYSGHYEVKNVPNVYSGDIHPTSPCMGSSSIGGAGVGFGFSFGSSWTDDECGIRETARSFNGMGLKEDALAVLCSSKYASVAPACKKE